MILTIDNIRSIRQSSDTDRVEVLEMRYRVNSMFVFKYLHSISKIILFGAQEAEKMVVKSDQK